MADRLEDIVKYRKLKLEHFKELGIDPYPSSTARTHSNLEIVNNFEQFGDKLVTVAGRIKSWRAMGKLVFAHIDDGTAKLQVLIKEDIVGQKQFEFLIDNFDLGDFLEATGTLFITKTNEKTVQASEFKMLAKALLPLPSEHFGIQDEETRLRKRYLDILLNSETKELFIKKNKFWSSMRSFLEAKGFLELQMPVLESVPGGAEAEPFVTHHNALNKDFYLRISLELPLKKMLVAGYEKVFEIGRIFRNEGIDTEHLQDYTQMEFYWAYGDFDKLMSFLQEMYQYVLQQTFNTLQITSNGVTCDWSGTWEKVSYIELFKTHTGIDLNTATDAQLQEYIETKKIKADPSAGRGRLIDIIFKSIRSSIPQDKPVFLVDQPIELEPLAKRDPKNPRIVQRAQIIAYGTELGKGFGELNDPIDQRARFEAQMKLRESGDSEAQMLDEDFVEAMEYGMPPAAGFGLSERLFAVLCDKSIRETVIFPPMHDTANKESKSKDTKIAVVIINKEAGMLPWQEMNTVAHLSASFAARSGKKLLYQDEISTEDGEKIKLNIQHAIMIKSGGPSAMLQKISQNAQDAHLEAVSFTREMIETTDDKKVISLTKAKKSAEVEYLGVLLFGKKSEVEALTKQLSLFE